MAHKKVRVAIIGNSSYFFKTPSQQFGDDICRDKGEAFMVTAMNNLLMNLLMGRQLNCRPFRIKLPL